MCSRDKEFTIKGTENCLARGFDRTGFFEVDTGEQRAWTVQLTESNETPAQRVPGIPGTVGPGQGGLPGMPGGTPPGAPGLPPAPGSKKMRRLRRIKILATLGPASSDSAMIRRLFEAGADVFRINMSHTSHDKMPRDGDDHSQCRGQLRPADSASWSIFRDPSFASAPLPKVRSSSRMARVLCWIPTRLPAMPPGSSFRIRKSLPR